MTIFRDMRILALKPVSFEDGSFYDENGWTRKNWENLGFKNSVKRKPPNHLKVFCKNRALDSSDGLREKIRAVAFRNRTNCTGDFLLFWLDAIIILSSAMQIPIPVCRPRADAIFRGLCLWARTATLVVASHFVAGVGFASPSLVPEVLNRYCSDCHDGEVKKGGLNLESIRLEDTTQHPDEWERVIRKLRARQMPPMGKDRPDERTYDAIVSRLASSLDRAAAKHPNPGRTETFRRLNRTEYQNAIRDLLAVDIDAAALLPKDDAGHGFDNVTVGTLSPALLDRYISAAQKISRMAVGTPGRSPGGETIRIRADVTQEEHVEGLPLGTRGGTLIPYTFVRDGEYEIQIRLARDRNEEVEGLHETHELEVLLDRQRVKSFTVAPRADKNYELIDAHLKVRFPVSAGPHKLGVTFLKNPSALLETKRQPGSAHFNMHRHPRLGPAIYQVSINGPYEAKKPGHTSSSFASSPREERVGRGMRRGAVDNTAPPLPGPLLHPMEEREKSRTDSPSRRKIFVRQPKSLGEEESCAEQILSTLMRRAYRRPITQDDLQKPMEFFQQARGESFEAGIESALSAILVSPEFLFRVEHDPKEIAPNTTYRITDLELASRLSFFLWSSIPDDELLDAAIHGDLHKPRVLEKQTRRMLADSRAQNLASNFAAQWLYLRNLDSCTPDARLFPDFDDNLRQAFREETELFFESILREDRSALDLLKADYTFLNERLAKHYGIPNIYGSRFRRVPLTQSRRSRREEAHSFSSDENQSLLTSSPTVEGHERGGLLRQGSILTVTSYATRTSPVIRGHWILGNLLGVPPPPPPGNVPALKENTISESLPMRERLAAHRANAACASCHSLMDPVGFSLENFDAIGRWRTVEDGQPIDVSGGLPDGRKFNGVSGLEDALRQRPDLFVGTLTEKLMTFALGRGIETYDAPAIRKIIRDAQQKDFRFSSLIVGIVKSAPFTMRKSL